MSALRHDDPALVAYAVSASPNRRLSGLVIRPEDEVAGMDEPRGREPRSLQRQALATSTRPATDSTSATAVTSTTNNHSTPVRCCHS